MFEIRRTDEFPKWLLALASKGARAAARIAQRLARVAQGNHGDVIPVGEGVSELRVDHGPGYRVYLKRAGREVILLLCGGHKSIQDRDIKRATALAREV